MNKASTLNIAKMLSADRVVDLISSKKENVLKELVQVMSTSKNVSNKLELYKGISEREKTGSTGIGYAVAVPHTRSSGISDFVIALGRKPEGIEFESPDGQVVNLVVMIGAPENSGEELLKILARVVLMFKNTRLKKKIIDAKSKTDVVQILKDY